TNGQGNHGEDAKEYWWPLEATPTHSLLRYLYRYPQAEFPYRLLLEQNARRGRDDPEFELSDTGGLDGNRFFDVVVSYAKAGPADICRVAEAPNPGPEPAPLHVLPQVWFRNTWSWGSSGHRSEGHRSAGPEYEGHRPELAVVRGPRGAAVRCRHPELGEYWF